MLPDTLVARAIERGTLSYGSLLHRPSYLLHCYPGDITAEGAPNAAARDMGASQSSCLLHCRGVLAADEADGRIAWKGKEIDALRCAYQPVIGMVESLLLELARQRGLLVTHADQDAIGDIQPADIVIIGSRGSAPPDHAAKAKWLGDWGGVAHGLFVTGVDGAVVKSTDGGQGDLLNGGKPTAIKPCERRLEKRGDGWWLGSRKVNWRLRAADLPLRLVGYRWCLMVTDEA